MNTGLSTDIGALTGLDWLVLAAVSLCATLGKLLAGTFSARLGGLGWHESRVVGVLLNTRGLTELIALNVGLHAGIITARLYTILVVMALVTTALTGPLLKLFGAATLMQATVHSALSPPTAAPATPPAGPASKPSAAPVT